jgi:hypothetical protein
VRAVKPAVQDGRPAESSKLRVARLGANIGERDRPCENEPPVLAGGVFRTRTRLVFVS